MFTSALKIILPALLAASTVDAHPSLVSRATCATPKDKTCQVVFKGCTASGSNVLKNAWAYPACIAAAICFDGGVDAMLSAATCSLKGSSAAAVKGTSITRLTTPMWTAAFPQGTQASSQNAIDFYYGTLSKLKSTVWPDVTTVQNMWSGVQAWTAFCGRNVPLQNFADFLQYNGVPGVCTGSGPANPKCAVPKDASCATLYATCVADANWSSPWDDTSCTLAATCFDGGLAAFASALSCASNGAVNDRANSWPRMTSATWNDLVNGASSNQLSQQNYIDSYFAELSCIGATSWPSVDFVQKNYGKIASWTGFSNAAAIPSNNWADWLTWA